MAHDSKCSGLLILRLIVGLALLGWPRASSAQGTWSVIAPSGTGIGEVSAPFALASGPAGNLYVADWDNDNADPLQLQMRDAQGNWSMISSTGPQFGQVNYPWALAADSGGNLYVADLNDHDFRIQKRDAQGNWSVIATVDGVTSVRALAVDMAGSLYIASWPLIIGDGEIQQLDAEGNWDWIAGGGTDPGEVYEPIALAVDAAGNLYVADYYRIQRRDVQGNWSLIAAGDPALGQVYGSGALAVDTAGNLYVLDGGADGYGRIQKRDVEGHWSMIADSGYAHGQVANLTALAVDGAGNLYATDTVNGRVLKYTPDP
jgi:hypothetical protein